MDDVIAKNFLLGKDFLSVKSNSESIKFFMRYQKDNKEECKTFLKQIEKYICELRGGQKLWYFFDNPYGDSVMLFEVRSKSDIMNSIHGRWEYLRDFASLKEG